MPTYLPATRYGGPIQSVHGLCRALVAAGHEVHVYSTSVDGDRDSDVPVDEPIDLDGVTIRYFPSTFLRRIYRAPRMAVRLGSDVANFDIVHLHSVFLWPTYAAARAARRAGVPYVIAPRGMLVRELVERKSRFAKSTWIRFVESSNFRHASGVHFTSRIEMEEAMKFDLRIANPFVVGNGVEVSGFSGPRGLGAPEEAGIDSGSGTGLETLGRAVDREIDSPRTPSAQRPTPALLFLGRVNWKKGLDRLVRAMELIPEARLTIAGNDEENYRSTVEGLADIHGVLDRIEFLGPVGPDRKWTLLRSARVLVLPSYNENFGNVVLEAMAVGCPVVVTPEVGLADAVRESGAGLVAGAGPEPLSSAIRSILENGEAAEEMGRRGIEAVRTKFSWKGVAEAMIAEYAKIAGASGRDT